MLLTSVARDSYLGTQELERVSIRNRAYSAVHLEDPEVSLLK